MLCIVRRKNTKLSKHEKMGRETCVDIAVVAKHGRSLGKFDSFYFVFIS